MSPEVATETPSLTIGVTLSIPNFPLRTAFHIEFSPHHQC